VAATPRGRPLPTDGTPGSDARVPLAVERHFYRELIHVAEKVNRNQNERGQMYELELTDSTGGNGVCSLKGPGVLRLWHAGKSRSAQDLEVGAVLLQLRDQDTPCAGTGWNPGAAMVRFCEGYIMLS
jgi:hypothetical protein